MSTLEDAQQTVLSIVKEFGYDEKMMNDLDQFKPEYRRTVEELLLHRDEQRGRMIKKLVEKINSTDAHFDLLELLRNADENLFENANAVGALPTIAFHIHCDRIIVECNEDGFTKENLAAICSVGKSTKPNDYGRVETRGNGFKSVFFAAYEAHIESGHFSFCFKHHKGDSGLGMVLPIWVDTNKTVDMNEPASTDNLVDADEPVGTDNEVDMDEAFDMDKASDTSQAGDAGKPLDSDQVVDADKPPNQVTKVTRTTLRLHKEGNGMEVGKALRDSIVEQLNCLRPTCLLFLRQLRRIEISHYNEDGGRSSLEAFEISGAQDHRKTLKRTLSETEDQGTAQEQYFHVTKHKHKASMAISTGNDPNSPNTVGANETSPETDIILAFPLEKKDNFTPVLQAQDIFAGLPVEKSRFNFLIHSDFDTTANPRRIKTQSERNTDLLQGVADAFGVAVEQLCKDEDLCCAWPEFLPSAEDELEIFWSGLQEKIKKSLSTLRILKSRKVDLLKSDLESPTSVLMSSETDEPWHSILSKRLLRMLKQSEEQTQIDRLKELKVLPVFDETWVAPSSGPVYMPTTSGGHPIPRGLKLELKVLRPDAVKNVDRKKLFEELGAVKAEASDVRAEILKAYDPGRLLVNLADSKANLEFLYLSHGEDVDLAKLRVVTVHQNDDIITRLYDKDIYLPDDDHPYGPGALLGPTPDSAGQKVTYLNAAYLRDAPEASSLLQWKEWLVGIIGVRRRLRIVDREAQTLSSAWKYVASHRPKRLLGLLQDSWEQEERESLKSPEVVSALQQVEAITQGGRSRELKSTWLPLPQLEQERLKFMEESEPFSFLELEHVEDPTSESQLATKWGFLDRFGVGVDLGDGIKFLLEVLRCIYMNNIDASSLRRPERLVRLYGVIHAKVQDLNCGDAERCEAAKKKIKRALSSSSPYLPHGSPGLIFVPAYGGEKACWTSASKCVWDSPPVMTSPYPLKYAYASLCEGNDEQLSVLSHFFKDIMLVQDAGLSNIKDNLDCLRQRNCQDVGQIVGSYNYLNTIHSIKPKRASEIRLAFTYTRRILAVKNHQPGWYKTSECLWSSPTTVQDKATLKDYYGSLEDFFTRILGVQMLTVDMVYNELKQTTAQERVERVKELIKSFSAQLQMDQEPQGDPDSLLDEVAFLPVRYPDGQVALESAETEFAIIDRQRLGELFQDKIKLLDYTFEEVHNLDPFLKWARLDHRYLSRQVKTTTSAPHAKRPVAEPNRNLEFKAHALVRIAAIFNSPRFVAGHDGLYQLLQKSELLEADEISITLSIDQGEVHYETPLISGDLHLDETSSGLQIFVPSDVAKQTICFHSALPKALAGWLMRDPKTGVQEHVNPLLVTILTSVLNVPAEKTIVDSILESHGIFSVLLPEISDDSDQKDGGGVVDLRHFPSRPIEKGLPFEYLSPRQVDKDIGEGEVDDSDTDDSETSDTVDNDGGGGGGGDHAVLLERESSTESSAPVYSQKPPGQNSDYKWLFKSVVLAARAVILPDNAFNCESIPAKTLSSKNSRKSFDWKKDGKSDHAKYVGAAGELYVFELLSGLNPPLPGWNWEVWTSQIRELANVHRDYTDLQSAEEGTSDFVYEDSKGYLTKVLINWNYLDRDSWKSARPVYHIEAKGTTSQWDEDFHISKPQYDQLQEKSIFKKPKGLNDVYMVFRVFGIGGALTGMRIYMDREGLNFKPNKWLVTPKKKQVRGPSPP
ncbi:hypothetical protein PspLS_08606, partial [Pyricularia sp. CBS 133598]